MGYKVVWVYRNPELNPYSSKNPFDILDVEGCGDIVDSLNDANTASVNILGRDKGEKSTPASMVKTDSGRSVYSETRDVTASEGAQDDSGRQAGLADKDEGICKNNRFLHHSELKCNVFEGEEGVGHLSFRTGDFSKASVSEGVDVEAEVNDPIHVFTLSEGVIVKVFDECIKGICSCNYKLHGEMLQLEPCRFAYLVSSGTAECKRAYEPLLSDITDGFKIVDDNMDLGKMHYECENYKSVYDPENKSKLDSIIGKELAEGYLKIVQEKPTCIHSMGAVPKPEGGIRPITDCSMPRDISVNNYCSDFIEDFQYKSVDHVLAMLQEGYYMAVVDIKSAYRAVPI